MLRRSIFANEPMDPSESSHSLHADVPRETEEGLPSETIDAKAGHAVRLAGSQDVTIDPGARELKHRGQLVVLAPPVFDCIAYLLANRERAVGRDELVAGVWGRVEIADATVHEDGPENARIFEMWAAAMAAHGIARDEANALFAQWAGEDRYYPLAAELDMLADAGFARPECFWKYGPMTVYGGYR